MAERTTESILTSGNRFASDLMYSWPKETAAGALFREALTDEDARARMLASPAESLGDAGAALPPGLQLSVQENSESCIHLVLPAEPRLAEFRGFPADFRVDGLKAIIGEACADASLRQRLMEEPVGALADRGFAPAPATTVVCHQNTGSGLVLVLPARESSSLIEKKKNVPLGKIKGTPEELDLTWVEPWRLRVDGAVDSATAGLLRMAIDKVSFDLDLDLGEVKFFSSQGIGILVRAQKNLAATGKRLRLINVPDSLVNVLKIFRLLDVLEIEQQNESDLMQLYHPSGK